MIQELGLSRNGEIYEEIVRWGKRMTDTTITSEKVVYRAAKNIEVEQKNYRYQTEKWSISAGNQKRSWTETLSKLGGKNHSERSDTKVVSVYQSF
jgi:hypothetical protein